MTTQPTYSPVPARTRALLRWIGDGGLASRAQLTRAFWPQARYPRAAYQYLRRLVQQGYLLSTPQTIRGRAYALYALTDAGSAALRVRPPFVRTGWPHPRETAHLLLGQEVRLHLEQHLARAGGGGQILAWRSEYLLRHLAPTAPALIPDLQIEFRRTATSSPEVLAVEVDGGYYGRLLQQKAVAYGASPQPVWWACLPHRASRIRRAVAAYPHIVVLPLTLS